MEPQPPGRRMRRPHHPNGDRETRLGAAYRRHHPVVWWVTLLAPPLVVAGVLLSTWATRGWPAAAGLVGYALSSLVAGKFIILGGNGHSQVLPSPEALAGMVVLMDVLTACWFVFHLGFVIKLPVVGPRFALLVADGENLLAAHPWVRRGAFVGLVVFVMIPFAMTGSVGGAIIARLLGMRRRAAFTAICLGSVLGAGLIYLGASALPTIVNPENPVWSIGGVVVLAALVILISRRYAQATRRMSATTNQSTLPE